MIIIVAFLIGAVAGGLRAKRKKGNRMDMAQYTFIFGTIFALFGLLITILIGRML